MSGYFMLLLILLGIIAAIYGFSGLAGDRARFWTFGW